jgi:hypothetical protein
MKNHFRVSCTGEKIGKHWDILSNVVRLSVVACKGEEGSSSSNLVCFKELKNTTLRNIYFSVPLYGNEVSILRKSDTHRLQGTEMQGQDIQGGSNMTWTDLCVCATLRE